jgi:hypothetical protein
MAGGNKKTPNTDTQRSKQSNVALAEQILKVSSVWASCSDGKNVGSRKPRRASRETKIFFNETERPSSKVKDDLRACW